MEMVISLGDNAESLMSERLTGCPPLVIVYRRSAIGARQVARKKTRQRECDSKPVGLPDDATAEELAQLAWAMAHPARVRIVRLLINREACVCGEIVAELPLAQSTVSQHLKILKQSGMIQGEIDGPKVCYCINVEKLDALKGLIAAL
jgi:ArsR family transcriptional regulator